jgi:hypothetical protein
MPRKTESKKIDGIEYFVTQMGAESGQRVIFRVSRALPSILRPSGFAPEDLLPEDFDFVLKLLVETTSVGIVDKVDIGDGKTVGDGRTTRVPLSRIYDDHFGGNWGPWAQWLKFCWEVNFGSFFDVVRGLARAATELRTSASPKAPTGGSGDSPAPSA